MIAAQKRQLHYNPAFSKWYFIVVICQFCTKTGFFHTMCVSKRTPTAFLVLVNICSIIKVLSSCFPTILQLLWLVLRALELLPRKNLEIAKNDDFAALQTKSDCSLWKQLQKHTLSWNKKKLAWTNNILLKNTQSKSSIIPSFKMLKLLDWGVVPSPSFISTSRRVRDKNFWLLAISMLFLLFH